MGDPYGATDKEKFDVMYKSLADYSDKFMGRFLSVFGFQLVALGWLLTSSTAQTFFKESFLGSVAAIVIAIATAMTFPPSIRRIWNAHLYSLDCLDKIKYMEKEYYQQHKLPKWYYSVAVGIVIVQYAALAILIAHWHWKLLSELRALWAEIQIVRRYLSWWRWVDSRRGNRCPPTACSRANAPKISASLITDIEVPLLAGCCGSTEA